MELASHTLTALVENRPGVLAGVAGLFARRGLNITTLAAAPTENARFSRLTLVVDVAEPVEKLTSQLLKLIHVVTVSPLHPAEAVERELLLATVSAEGVMRCQLMQLLQLFDANVEEVGRDELTLMLAGTPARLDDLEAFLEPYEVTRLLRSGRIALPRLRRTAFTHRPRMERAS